MSTALVLNPPGDFQYIHSPIYNTPDADPDVVDLPQQESLTCVEDPDLGVRIYRKSGSQFSLRSASSTQMDNVRYLRHTGKIPRASPRGGSTPYGSTDSLETPRPLPDGLLVYPLLDTGMGMQTTEHGNTFNDEDGGDDILSDDWTMWLPRPRKACTLGPNFKTTGSPKKKRPNLPDYIAEITAPLAQEEDFDFMITPTFFDSQIGAVLNSRNRRKRKRTVRTRFLRAVRKMFRKD